MPGKKRNIDSFSDLVIGKDTDIYMIARMIKDENKSGSVQPIEFAFA